MLPAMQKRLLVHIPESIIGYITTTTNIIYITHTSLVTLQSSGAKTQHKISGNEVVNFVAGEEGQLAILYRSNYMEIRRGVDVVRRFQNIPILGGEQYPLMKLESNELYLVYPTSIEIYFLRDGSKSKYTELFSQSPLSKITDLLLLNLVGSLSIGVLQLRNKLVMAIIPCTITQLHIEAISQIMCLYPSSGVLHPKTSYLAVLAEETNIKIFDLTALKQIAQIQVSLVGNVRIEMEVDPGRQFLVVHYMHKQTGNCLNNLVYKINTTVYYSQNRHQHTNAPFLLYSFEIPMHDCLSPYSFSSDHLYHLYTFYYFRQGDLIQLVKKMPNCYQQTEEAMQCLTDQTFWQENPQWKDIIDTYLKLEQHEMMQYSQIAQEAQEERLLQEYYEITKDFDSIVNTFSQMITVKGKSKRLSKEQVEEEWQQYMLGIAKQRNYRKETIKLFKIDYQVVKQPHQEKNLIGIELENCMREMEGREKRVDARIREKQKELEQQKMKRDHEEKEKAKKQKVTLTEEQIKKEQDEYNKFVEQYLAELERKQAQQDAKSKAKKHSKIPENIDPQFKLQMPTLNEQQKKLIQQHKSCELSRVSSISSQKKEQKEEEVNPAWQQFAKILEQVQCQVSPLQVHLQKIIDKLDRIQHSSLEQIKQNEQRLSKEMEIDLQQVVRSTCRSLFSKMQTRIKQQLSSSMQKLHQIQQKTILQTEQSITNFKQFAKLQLKHRIDPYHKSRRTMQLNAQMYVKEGRQSEQQIVS